MSEAEDPQNQDSKTQPAQSDLFRFGLTRQSHTLLQKNSEAQNLSESESSQKHEQILSERKRNHDLNLNHDSIVKCDHSNAQECLEQIESQIKHFSECSQNCTHSRVQEQSPGLVQQRGMLTRRQLARRRLEMEESKLSSQSDQDSEFDSQDDACEIGTRRRGRSRQSRRQTRTSRRAAQNALARFTIDLEDSDTKMHKTTQPQQDQSGKSKANSKNDRNPKEIPSKKKKLRKLSKIQVNFDPNSHQSISPRQSMVSVVETCAICLDEIEAENKAKLDQCKHVYCLTCIQQWVKDCSNSCPQCKSDINQIIPRQGKPIEVEEKKIDADNFIYLICEACNLQITEEQLEMRRQNQDSAAICEDCMEWGLHRRCMSKAILKKWLQGEDLMCTRCCENESDDSEDSEEDGEFDELDQDALEQFMVTFTTGQDNRNNHIARNLNVGRRQQNVQEEGKLRDSDCLSIDSSDVERLFQNDVNQPNSTNNNNRDTSRNQRVTLNYSNRGFDLQIQTRLHNMVTRVVDRPQSSEIHIQFQQQHQQNQYRQNNNQQSSYRQQNVANNRNGFQVQNLGQNQRVAAPIRHINHNVQSAALNQRPQQTRYQEYMNSRNTNTINSGNQQRQNQNRADAQQRGQQNNSNSRPQNNGWNNSANLRTITHRSVAAVQRTSSLDDEPSSREARIQHEQQNFALQNQAQRSRTTNQR